jgi:predicted alpha/beta superfamily hydrolase
LAIQAIRRRGTADVVKANHRGAWAIVRLAVVTSLLNPKALLFFLVLLPQFVESDRGSITAQLAILGTLLSIVAFAFHALLGVFSAASSRWIPRGGKSLRGLNLLQAGVFFAIALRLLLLERPAYAAETAPAHESLRIESSVMSETRRINVYRPPGYEKHREIRYPVLYLPDGGMEEDFPHVATAADRLIRQGDTRPFLIVGIENTVRRRDMTGPTSSPEDLKFTDQPGGAPRFRKFLRFELMPTVQARFRVSNESAIMGESLAGLFVVDTLFHEPRLFHTYIALDPSLWWNAEGLIREAAARLPALRGRSVRLLMSSGGPQSNVIEIEKLAAALKRYAPSNVQWEYRARPELRHDNIYRAMDAEMLRAAFGHASSADP